MALRDFINKLLGRTAQPDKQQKTTDTGSTDAVPKSLNKLSQMWKVYDDRKSIWTDIEDMDMTDEIVSGSLDVIADRTTAFDREDVDGFYIESDSQEVKDMLMTMVRRTGLDSSSWDIIRSMSKHGSHFCELVVAPDDNMFQIIRIKQFPRQYEIVRNENEHGVLLNGDAVDANKRGLRGVAAYDQIDELQYLLAAFFAWQIIHFRYGRMQGMPYPTPYFCSARKNWKRLQLLEDGMAVARLVRAYTKLAHEVLMPVGLSDIEQQKIIDSYRSNISKSRVPGFDSSSTTVMDRVDAPYSVDTDFYIPAYYSEDAQGRIIKVSPDLTPIDVSNPQLQNLTDIRYSLNRLISRTKVPAKYLNFDIGQPRFSEQGMGPEEEQFGIVLKKIQMSYKIGVRQACDLELMLHGIDPLSVNYEIVMPEISMRNQSRRAQIEESYARAGSMWIAALSNAGVPIPWDIVGKNFLRLRGDELDKFMRNLKETANIVYTMFGEDGVGDNENRMIETPARDDIDERYQGLRQAVEAIIGQMEEIEQQITENNR